MRKRIFMVAFAIVLMASMILPATALAGGKNKVNGNSDNFNKFCVVHQGANLWLPNRTSQQAHLNNGDKECVQIISGP